MFRLTLIWLFKILSPSGRAYRMPEPSVIGDFYTDEDGNFIITEDEVYNYVPEGTEQSGGIYYRLCRALAAQLDRCKTAAYSILNDILPDNPLFDQDDATSWYRRLGIYNSGNVPLADMKAAILQRMSFPIVPLRRQNYLFIQEQLQLAGFDVWVYPNRFPDGMGGWMTQTPGQVLGVAGNSAQYGFPQYAQVQYGQEGVTPITLIVNYFEEAKDQTFAVGANLKSTFFLAGATINTFADVPESRRLELRQLILKLKEQQTVGIMFINYV